MLKRDKERVTPDFGEIRAFLGEGTQFKGVLSFAGAVRVDGRDQALGRRDGRQEGRGLRALADQLGRLSVPGARTDARQPDNVDWNIVEPGYFATMGIALRAGRAFGAQDDRAAPKVAIVNETLARRFFPGGYPPSPKL